MKVTNYHVSFGFERPNDPFHGSVLGDTFVKAADKKGGLNEDDIRIIKKQTAKNNGVDESKMVIISITKLNKEEIPDEKWERLVA